ncbi:MAG: OmpA family protein [Cytophagales bacterium]|nr:OmpA family protein [Cytophagales bacterium]
MRKVFALFLGLFFYGASLAQETVIWGSEVVDVSSEFSPYEYSGIQALHKPNVLPAGGDNPNAWRPKNDNSEQFIMVSFKTPIKAKQVAIAESENPGAVIKIIAYDEDYNEYDLFPELTPRALPIDSRLLNLFFEETTYKIQAIRIVLNGEAVPGFNSIDAIGISLSNIPINVLINLAKNMNEELQADKLGKNVNSEYTEHSPVLSPDGKRLYFSRQYHPDNIGGVSDHEDIWVSELDEETGDWLPARNVGPPLNTEGPNFISSISIVDGKELVVLGNRYGKKGRMYTGSSMAVREGDTFSIPTSIEIENDYNYSRNADFFMVSGGKSMLTSAERDDTYGLRDLYITFQKRDGTWTEPKNLGGDINTVGEEESPFLADDTKTLYFSTNGQSGYGGKDIYVSIRLDDTWTKWSAPENLGSGINKKGDDEYFSIPTTGQYAYFTRGDEGEDMDIFTFKVEDLFVEKTGPIYESMRHLIEDEVTITVQGIVYDTKTEEVVSGASVLIERLPDGVDIGTAISDDDGFYRLTVLPGARYGIVPTAEGYFSQSENFDFNNLTETDTINQDLSLVPKGSGLAVVFNNIFFDFDRSILQTSSYPELGRVHKLMQDGTLESIVIAGHTDSIGAAEYNWSLSKKRARAVYNYFLERGIAKDRLEYVGYGETKPAFPNDKKANQAKNRRVEFTIKE